MGNKVHLDITLDTEVSEEIKRILRKTHTPLSPLINSLLKDWIEKNSNKDILKPESIEEPEEPTPIKPMKPIPVIPEHFETIKPAKRFNRI